MNFRVTRFAKIFRSSGNRECPLRKLRRLLKSGDGNDNEGRDETGNTGQLSEIKP